MVTLGALWKDVWVMRVKEEEVEEVEEEEEEEEKEEEEEEEECSRMKKRII